MGESERVQENWRNVDRVNVSEDEGENESGNRNGNGNDNDRNMNIILALHLRVDLKTETCRMFARFIYSLTPIHYAVHHAHLEMLLLFQGHTHFSCSCCQVTDKKREK